MVDNYKNIELVVQALKEYGIHHIVISPGGTNKAFVKKVQDDEFFTCYSIIDERSAMYVAIGIYLQTKEVVATSCTSAQATRNYIPGLTEAYYKRVPILAITMEKHARFKYQEYMQAPDQTSLPVDCVKKSFELPSISDVNDVIHSIRIINEAILETTNRWNGPVQLCIPWLDMPITDDNVCYRTITRCGYESKWNVSLFGKKTLVVIGEQNPFTESEKELFDEFCNKYDVTVYTNLLSNYHGRYSVNANLALSTMKLEDFWDYKPDVVITFGGQTGDYPLFKLLSKNELKNVEHWRVHPDGRLIDTYDKLTHVFSVENIVFLHRMNQVECMDTVHSYYNSFAKLVAEKNNGAEVPFSNVYAANKLSKCLPANSVLQLSILNTLRVWNWFEFDESIECYSNVGAFGIDGGLSTLIGQSLATNKKCFMVVGDLAFLYDINSISIRQIKNNLRILLVNNNGGIEFKLKYKDDLSLNKYVAAENHFKNAKGWAETCGFNYISARNKNEFDFQIDNFIGESEYPVVFEIFVSEYDEILAYETIMEANLSYSIKDKVEMGKDAIKDTIKRIIGR